MSSQAVASVDHDGFARIAGDTHLLDEHIALDVTRRVVVVVIQSDLADRDDFRVRREFGKPSIGFAVGLRGIVRMHTNGRVNKWITVRQADAHFEVRRSVAGADRHHRFDAGGERPLDHGFAVVVELFAV